MLRIRALALMLVAALGIGTVGDATAAPFILVSNGQAGTISVIDAATNSLATTVPVAASSVGDIAVAPGGAFAYVASSGTVWVIDTAAGAVTDAIRVDAGLVLREFAFTRDGALAYVVDLYADVVWVIDTASRTVIDSLDLPVTDAYGDYFSIAIAPDDSRLYVVQNAGCCRPSTLLIVDPSANRVVAAIPVGEYSSEVALSPDGALAYVVNQCDGGVGCGSISVVDTSSGTVIDTIPTGQAGSQYIAITQDGRHAYVSNTGSNSVSVIDLGTRQVVGAPIPVGLQPTALVITPDQKFVYVGDVRWRNGGVSTPDYYGSVSVIETATNTMIATIPVRAVRFAIAPTFTLVPPPECADIVDNDGDGGVAWGSDPGCDSPFDASERSADLVCDDGIDNDGDGLTDYPTDPGCAFPSANVEDPVCNNGIDDDGDGLADFPADPACTSAFTESERAPWLACDDGYDNDFDGFTDYPADLDCRSLSIGFEETDVDSDGLALRDNCALISNPSQLDSDLDGYGNACDADYDEDGIVTNRDLIILRIAFGSTIATSEYQGPLDYDGDGVIEIVDFRRLRSDLGSPPYVASLDADGDGAIGKSDFKLVRSTLRNPPGPSQLTCAETAGSCYCEYNSCGGS